MHMNVLLAREVRGAQDTIRELVAMGSRILALAVGLGAPVDLTSQPSDSLGPSVCGATGALLHAACITPVARCTTARRPRRRASAGPQTRESQTRHRRWDMYRRRGGGGHAGGGHGLVGDTDGSLGAGEPRLSLLRCAHTLQSSSVDVCFQSRVQCLGCASVCLVFVSLPMHLLQETVPALPRDMVRVPL